MEELHVSLDPDSGDWTITAGDKVLARWLRREDARADARQRLRERGDGTAVIHSPSGSITERIDSTGKVVEHAA
jgi:Uncharacterized protein conserved in bacteria (DUF2188)